MEFVAVFFVLVVIFWWMGRKGDSDKSQFKLLADRQRKIVADRKQRMAADEKQKGSESFRLNAIELEAIRKSELEADLAAELEIEKAELEANLAAKLEREEIRKAKEVAAEKLKLNLSALKANLPFYTSNRTPSTELAEHDKNMWDESVDLIKNENSEMTTLYFVKLKSLMDDQEYFKIGITTEGVETRFKKSTQLELIEVIKVFDTEKWKAAFLEYHFLREFRLYDGLANSLGELRPEVGFSGYTEVVRSNSVTKISEYFEELDVYNEVSINRS